MWAKKIKRQVLCIEINCRAHLVFILIIFCVTAIS